MSCGPQGPALPDFCDPIRALQPTGTAGSQWGSQTHRISFCWPPRAYVRAYQESQRSWMTSLVNPQVCQKWHLSWRKSVLERLRVASNSLLSPFIKISGMKQPVAVKNYF